MHKLETRQAAIPKVRRPRASHYPFETMAVGDFFFVPGGRPGTLYVTTSRAGSRLGRRFRTRYVPAREILEGWEVCAPEDDGAVWGVGVWRDD